VASRRVNSEPGSPGRVTALIVEEDGQQQVGFTRRSGADELSGLEESYDSGRVFVRSEDSTEG